MIVDNVTKRYPCLHPRVWADMSAKAAHAGIVSSSYQNSLKWTSPNSHLFTLEVFPNTSEALSVSSLRQQLFANV